MNRLTFFSLILFLINYCCVFWGENVVKMCLDVEKSINQIVKTIILNSIYKIVFSKKLSVLILTSNCATIINYSISFSNCSCILKKSLKLWFFLIHSLIQFLINIFINHSIFLQNFKNWPKINTIFISNDDEQILHSNQSKPNKVL